MFSVLLAVFSGGLRGILTVGLWTLTLGVAGRDSVGEGGSGGREAEGLMLAMVERAFLRLASSGVAVSPVRGERRYLSYMYSASAHFCYTHHHGPEGVELSCDL